MKLLQTLFVFTFLILINFNAFSQEEDDIVKIIDDLTLEWDELALKMENYEGLRDFCHEKVFRDNSVRLLDQIHHYDSVLYKIVREKYDDHGNKEAKKTLDDIEELESAYTTREFLVFLRKECVTINDIEMNKAAGSYQKDTNKLEKEAQKFLTEITEQIDLVDEHVHHLGEM